MIVGDIRWCPRPARPRCARRFADHRPFNSNGRSPIPATARSFLYSPGGQWAHPCPHAHRICRCPASVRASGTSLCGPDAPTERDRHAHPQYVTEPRERPCRRPAHMACAAQKTWRDGALMLHPACGCQPCFCLCFGFSQIIMTRPLRLMILHFSQMGLTEGLTFMVIPPILIGSRQPFNPSAETI